MSASLTEEGLDPGLVISTVEEQIIEDQQAAKEIILCPEIQFVQQKSQVWEYGCVHVNIEFHNMKKYQKLIDVKAKKLFSWLKIIWHVFVSSLFCQV